MRQPFHKSRFAKEAADGIGVLHQAGFEEFDRDVFTAARWVARQQHFAHAAFAQPVQNLEPVEVRTSARLSWRAQPALHNQPPQRSTEGRVRRDGAHGQF
jgi:hypothetical protein